MSNIINQRLLTCAFIVNLRKIIGKVNVKIMLNQSVVNESGFCPGDSCLHLLVFIVYEVYDTFDKYPSLEVSGVFLYISKAFENIVLKGFSI